MTWRGSKMRPDGYDRYVGLWEFLVAHGVPSQQIHHHLDELVERLEERLAVLQLRHDTKAEELHEIEVAINAMRITQGGVT